MALSRFTDEQRFHPQPRAKRSLHQPNTLHANTPVVASVTRERGAKSLEPAIVAAGNLRDASFIQLSRGCVDRLRHALQPSKPPRNGKANAATRSVLISRFLPNGGPSFSSAFWTTLHHGLQPLKLQGLKPAIQPVLSGRAEARPSERRTFSNLKNPWPQRLKIYLEAQCLERATRLW